MCTITTKYHYIVMWDNFSGLVALTSGPRRENCSGPPLLVLDFYMIVEGFKIDFFFLLKRVMLVR